MDLKYILKDASAQYYDEVEKAALQELRKFGKRRAASMYRDARKKTGAMARGVASIVHKGVKESTVEIGGTERKTPWLEYGTKPSHQGRGKGTRPYPFVLPNIERPDPGDEYATELSLRVDKIRDLV